MSETYTLIECGREMDRMTYADALRSVLDYGLRNRIDEVDMAFGDEGLAEQRDWQDRAMGTVTGFLDEREEALFGLSYAPTSGGDHPTPIEASRDMDPGRIVDALRIVVDLASGGVVEGEETGDDLSVESLRKVQAIEVVKDLVGMHGAELEPRLVYTARM